MGFPINPPIVPMVDSNGLCSTPWYIFFCEIQRLIGVGSPFDDLQLLDGKPVSPDNDRDEELAEFVPPISPPVEAFDLGLSPYYGSALTTNEVTANYLAKGTGTGLGDSIVYDDGTNVSVGTTTSQQKFTVSLSSGTEGLGIGIVNTNPGGSGSGLTLYSQRSDSATIKAAASVIAKGSAAWDTDGHTSSALVFSTISANTFAERMRLDGTGLGIGTVTPGFPLDVNGVARVTNLRIEQAPTAAAGIASTHKQAISLSGTVYYIMLSNV